MSAALHRTPRLAPGRPSSAATPLLDLLGATWSVGAAVGGVAWDGDLACFALGDGSLAMGRAEWAGAPALQPRAEGGLQITPGAAPPPPMVRLRVHRGACLAVARDPAGGFLSGGEDGLLAHTAADGTITQLASQPGQGVSLVAAGAGLRAWAVGTMVHLSGTASAALDLPGPATALAFDPAGERLAAAHDGGVTLWSADAATRSLRAPGCSVSAVWSPDGRSLVVGLAENALHAWQLADGADIAVGVQPGRAGSLSFAATGEFVASSGAPRVLCWPWDPPASGSQPVECGMPSSRTPVCAVACHPTHPLVAAAYGNGAVLLCQPGSDDVLFARASAAGRPGLEPGVVPDGSGVTALAWSPDGTRLAMATQGGEIGLLACPTGLFRFGTAPPMALRPARTA